jgi:hypothetical protein
MIRIRTIIAVVAGALAIAVPVGTASAADPAAPTIPASVSTMPPSADAIYAQFQATENDALNQWQDGMRAAVDRWTAGANAALSAWQRGAQMAADRWQAQADALKGIQANLQAGVNG